MTGYNVKAERAGDLWELHIEGIGVTQTHTLGDAERMVRDYLHLDGHPDALTGPVNIWLELDGLQDEVEESKRATANAIELQMAAAENSRRIARKLRERGLSVSDTAHVLGVSRGRVSQLTGK